MEHLQRQPVRNLHPSELPLSAHEAFTVKNPVKESRGVPFAADIFGRGVARRCRQRSLNPHGERRTPSAGR